MWDKGLWIKQEYVKECPVCKQEFKTTFSTKKFCCDDHLRESIRNPGKVTLENYISRILLHKRRKSLTVEDILDLYQEQEGKCALSSVEMTFIRGQGRIPTNIGIDRIEAGGPYVKENIRLVCNHVNTMRLDKTDEEFLWWCRKIIDTSPT